MLQFSFSAALVSHNESPGSWKYFILPDEVNDVINSMPRVFMNIIPVSGTCNGKPFTSRIMPFSSGQYKLEGGRFISTNQKLRAQLGLKTGDTADLQIEIDL